MSTASLTTAAEMAKAFWLEHSTGPVWPDDVEALTTLLTTYAAQVRRDTLEECAKIADKRLNSDGYGYLMGANDAAFGIGKEIRALPPGSPSSQTDTGDNATIAVVDAAQLREKATDG